MLIKQIVFVLLHVLIILVQMSNTLSILSWNVRCIMSSSICLSSMLDRVKCDIAIISEHKLKQNNASYLDSIHPDYKSYTRSESTNTSTHCSRFLGKGGIAVMYKKELELSICELTYFDSSRFIGLEIRRPHDRSLYIFGVYLPSDNIIQSYSTELYLLEDLVAHFSSLGDVIIGGDFNASIYDGDAHHVNVYKSRLCHA